MLFIVIISCVLGLGIFVFLKGSEKLPNSLFLLLVISIVLWLVANFLLRVLNDPQYTLIILKTTYAAGVLMLYFLLVFSLEFPKRLFKKLSIAFLTGLIPTVLLVWLSFSGLLITGFGRKDEIILAKYGSGYPFIAAFIVIYLLAIFVIIFFQYKTASGILKQQARFLFIGIVSSALIIVVFGLIGPILLKNEVMANYDYIGILFLVVCAAYAIVKHRFMGIEFIVRKSLVYSVVTAVILGIFVFLFFLFSKYFQDNLDHNFVVIAIITSILLAVGINPLKNLIQKIVDKIFFSKQADLNKSFKELESRFKSGKSLKEIVEKLENISKKMLKVEKIDFLVQNSRTGRFVTPEGSEKKLALEPLNPILEYFSKDFDILVRDEIEFIKQEKQARDRKSLESVEDEMKKDKVMVVIPFGSKDRLLAVALLPPKINKEAFSVEDIKFLKKLSLSLGLYLENYLLYLNAMERARREANDH